MGMGFQFEQHSLGLWDLSWDLKKTISWEMGLGPPLHDPQENSLNNHTSATFCKFKNVWPAPLEQPFFIM